MRAAVCRPALAALVGAVIFGGCAPFFTGPYPCAPGYTSCNGNSQCETSIADDALNCGACGAACAQGALCQSGSCTEAPVPLASTLALTSFALNDTDAFFWSADATSGVGLSGVHKAGGGFTVPLADQYAPTSPNGLAADDAHVYYWAAADAMSPDGGAPIPEATIVSVPAPGGGSGRTLATLDSTPVNGTALTLIGTTLILAISTPGLSIDVVPATGGSPTPVATFTTIGAVGFDANNVYTSALDSPCDVQSTPLTGGMPVTLAGVDMNGSCPTALASDGSYVYWAGASYVYANGNAQSTCTMQIGSIPIGGGSVRTLASVMANEAPVQMLVDGQNLYVATGQSVWRLPTAGGTPVRVAGALNPATSSCLVGEEYTAATSVAMAVDATSLFVAACANCTSVGSGGLLFKLPK